LHKKISLTAKSWNHIKALKRQEDIGFFSFLTALYINAPEVQ